MAGIEGLGRLVASTRPHRRVAPRASRVGDRLHIQLRRVWPDQVGGFLAALTDSLADVPVAWFDARLLDATLVVALADGASERVVLEAVETAEARAGIAVNPFPEHRHGAPVEDEPLLRAAAELAADVFAFGASLTLRALRVPPPPFEIDVEGLVALVQNVPGLRRTLARWIGRASAEAAAGVAAAAVSAFTQNPISPVVGCAYHSLRLSELRARQEAWLAAEPDLYGRGGITATSSEPAERPVPRPPGLAERYAELTWVASLGTFVATLPFTGSIERALSVLASGAPKAARLGREAFGSHLGSDLARRGLVVMRPGSLRLLDQIDAAVVDGQLWTHDHDARLLARVAAANDVELVVAGKAPGRERRPAGSRPVPVRVVPAADAVGEVRRLQIAGRVVATIGGSSFAVLPAGDLAVGVADGHGRSPDGSHVVCRSGLRDAARVIAAVGPARQASRESAQLSLAGAVAGAVFAMAPPVAPRGRVLMAIDAAALMAVANAVRHAHQATAAAFQPQPVSTVADAAPRGWCSAMPTG